MLDIFRLTQFREVRERNFLIFAEHQKLYVAKSEQSFLLDYTTWSSTSCLRREKLLMEIILYR